MYLTLLIFLNLEFCLNEDECSFADCSKILDFHSDCLEGKSGYVFDACVAASELSDNSGEHNGLRKFVILLHKTVHHVFNNVRIGFLSKARTTAMNKNVVALVGHLNF